MDDNRTYQVKKKTRWQEVPFWSIKKGDVFRVVDVDGKPFDTEYTASSDARQMNPPHGAWVVDLKKKVKSKLSPQILMAM